MLTQRPLAPWFLPFAVLVVLAFLVVGYLLWGGAASGGGPATVTITWTTKSELNTAGYHLYRAESAQGQFVQITRQLIPAANDPLVGGTYVYTDTGTVSGVTYYYELEDVELTGSRTRHGAIAVTARSPGLSVFGWTLPDAIYWLAGLAAVVGVAFLSWRGRRAPIG